MHIYLHKKMHMNIYVYVCVSVYMYPNIEVCMYAMYMDTWYIYINIYMKKVCQY